MRKKLQIFISSTYSDLKVERQACVEAVLRAGHIPAGMELFSAGSESQLEIIKRWIEDSDVYMLLLGGRYGSIEPKSDMSYTEFEYRYAQELNKPYFAVVMADEYLNDKVKTEGKEVLELVNPNKHGDFRKFVLSKISRFFRNENDIKLAILESLLDIQSRFDLTGWVRASEIPDVKAIIAQMEELTDRNKSLEQEIRILEAGKSDKMGDFTYNELKTLLEGINVTIPTELSKTGQNEKMSVFKLFIQNRKWLSIGVTDQISASKREIYLITHVVSHLRIYDLAEIVKVPGVAWSRYQTSKLGNSTLR